MPSWISLKAYSVSSGLRHQRYDRVKDLLYKTSSIRVYLVVLIFNFVDCESVPTVGFFKYSIIGFFQSKASLSTLILTPTWHYQNSPAQISFGTCGYEWTPTPVTSESGITEILTNHQIAECTELLCIRHTIDEAHFLQSTHYHMRSHPGEIYKYQVLS